MANYTPTSEFFYRSKFPYPRIMGDYSEDEYKRIAKLSRRWYKFLGFFSISLMICFTVLFTYALYYLYLGFCYLLPREGTWYFQHIVPFIIPGFLLSFPISFLAAYEIVRKCQPNDFNKIVDFVNVRSGYDGIAAYKWTLKGVAWFTIFYIPLCGSCFIAVRPDGIQVKQVFSRTSKHYNYSDISRVLHYKKTFDSTKNEWVNDHYDIILSNGVHIWSLAPISDDPSGYHKKIIEMGKLKVEEADQDFH